MKRANSEITRTALHEMRMFATMQEAIQPGHAAGLYFARIERIQKALDDDDQYDPRVVRQRPDGTWEDIPT